MKLVHIILEQDENLKIDSALKQTFDQLGKQLANSSDEIVQDKNNVNEAVGIVLVAGIALAIPEIVKIIGQVTKAAGKFLGGTGATGDAIIAKAKKMHHLLLKPIEWGLVKLGLPKDKAHKAAEWILLIVVAGLMVTSGVGAVKAKTAGNLALAGLEQALAAVKSNEVAGFLTKVLSTI